jgi:Asp-tRNA(Asn)/Glu-tRNA(Gln) amidotransferase A subunit family amidase
MNAPNHEQHRTAPPGVAELAAQLRAKQVSATEAAQHFLARAKPTRTWAPSWP